MRSNLGGYFRALAVDFDGTLTEGDHVRGEVLEAFDAARRLGVRIVLVTGRIFAELVAIFPEVDGHVDAVVAENGCVVSVRGHKQLVGASNPRLLDSLRAAEVACRPGEVLIAASAADASRVMEQLQALRLDLDVVLNRGELMVVPPGVSKASGLSIALAELGLSPHNTIAIGDAENDAAMLELCGLAVAVANAVAPLKALADVVLTERNGLGVANFVRDSLQPAADLPQSSRFDIAFGSEASGGLIRLALPRLNLAIVGGSGEGKSYLSGYIAEQLILAGYSLLVIDPEGEYLGLGDLPSVVIVDGELTPLTPESAAELFTSPSTSVVVNLSGCDPDRRSSSVSRVREGCEALRRTVGRPHWIVVDEAQDSLGLENPRSSWITQGESGHCLVTWRPEDLPYELAAAMDTVILLGGSALSSSALRFAAEVGALTETEVTDAFPAREGQALFVRRGAASVVASVSPSARRTLHFRHDEKYRLRGVDEPRQFYLRVADPSTAIRVANLHELTSLLSECERAVLRYHCPHRDISRWVADVFRDRAFAQEISTVEAFLESDSDDQSVEAGRRELLSLLHRRLGIR